MCYVSFVRTFIAILCLCLGFFSCSTGPNQNLGRAEKALNQFFERAFQEDLEDSPEFAATVGKKIRYGQWDEISEEKSKQDVRKARARTEELKAFKVDRLSDAYQTHLRFYLYLLEEKIESAPFRYHSFAINQMFGVQSYLPEFLINFHLVENEQHILDYISRVLDAKKRLEQTMNWTEAAEKKGIWLPSFVVELALADIEKLLVKAGHPVIADFKKKLSALKLNPEQARLHEKSFEIAFEKGFLSGYKSLKAFLKSRRNKKSSKSYWGAAWQLPNGSEYYRESLRYHTTTTMNAKEIHHYGLKEVARIQKAMRALAPQLGHRGQTLKGLFKFVQQSRSQYFPSTSAGKQSYLAETQKIIDEAQAKISEVLSRPPKTPLEVKPVEAYREKSAGLAFYNQPSESGGRPGIYYVNLHDMQAVSRYEMRALAFHEAIPGHHMQLAKLVEDEQLPSFRKQNAPNAYTEGWGLYAERLAGELGLYPTAWDQFGQLSMELLRSVRLVVDTGLHAFKWTPQRSVEYFVRNTPFSREQALRSVRRYLVLPGQATSYKIGMKFILDQRALAKTKLGDKFKLTEFHDRFLEQGPLPLFMMDY